jgi:hypothetical protein
LTGVTIPIAKNGFRREHNMSDKGVTFAGNGGQDATGTMKDVPGASLSSGGPLQSPKGSDQGMSASGNVVNEVGDVPKGGGVKFAGGSDW